MLISNCLIPHALWIVARPLIVTDNSRSINFHYRSASFCSRCLTMSFIILERWCFVCWSACSHSSSQASACVIARARRLCPYSHHLGQSFTYSKSSFQRLPYVHVFKPALLKKSSLQTDLSLLTRVCARSKAC